jgi:hypothetical protein
MDPVAARRLGVLRAHMHGAEAAVRAHAHARVTRHV